eukprot:CAMPEP_0175846042 /NCGR_PEP_ID=MMETSP0107_2-20121207/22566_1 /TAXON_ID=195067 ORGANISM="Goniomonas pacifica, Strain CCMP1869" /NCGR_SAMPLE_ID=MMETSP0107_2 /ASSEMBLY_ACC=CAM_ASM_000203 /LENGTH=31 /DNA_ID= /DNA_START= /DNA_END= /DNA_ORIENTATION=
MQGKTPLQLADGEVKELLRESEPWTKSAVQG